VRQSLIRLRAALSCKDKLMTLQTQELVIRPGTLDDVTDIVDLTNRCSEVESGTFGGLTVETLTNQYTSDGFDLAEDIRVAYDPEGALVGAAEFWCFEPYTQPFVWARVLPGREGQGIGTALVTWAEDRAQAVMHRAPADARYSLRANILSTQTAALDLFRDLDYQVIRHFFTMEIAYGLDDALPEPVWPEGIRVRTHNPGPDDRPVFEAVDEAFRDHWGYTPMKYDRFRQSMIDAPEFEPHLWFLAVADGPEGERLAGFSLCRSQAMHDPNSAYVAELGVRRPWRRRGVALALLHHTFRVLQGMGIDTVSLGVDASSLTGATRLYEKAGMHVAERWDFHEKILRDGRVLATETLGD
jgi:mycothiol synthase